jgi:hypothetical protein
MTKPTLAELSRECATCLFFNSSIGFTDGRLHIEVACEQYAAAFPGAHDCPHNLVLDYADED